MNGARAAAAEPRIVGALAAIVGAAVAVRLYRLDALSFWLDEGYSAMQAALGRPEAWGQDRNPPLYYAILTAWNLIRDDDWWLRLFSVLCGVATVPVVYAIGRRLYGPAAGLWAAGLLAVLSFHVRYSQEARMYALLTLLWAVALWALVRATRAGQKRDWAVYAVAAALLLYTHGTALVHLGTLAVLFPFVAPSLRDRRAWAGWVAAHAVALALFLPWLPRLLWQITDMTAHGWWVPLSSGPPPVVETIWRFGLSRLPPPSALLRSELGIETGRLLGPWVWRAAIIAALIAGLTAAPRRAGLGLAMAFALPAVALAALSHAVLPVLIPRVLAPGMIPLVLLLGAAAAQSRLRPVARHALLGAVALAFLLGTSHFFRHFEKERWRDASGFLQREVGPRDLVILDVRREGAHLLQRYDKAGRLATAQTLFLPAMLDRCPDRLVDCLDAALPAGETGRRVWLVHSSRLALPARQAQAFDAWVARRIAHRHPRTFSNITVESGALGP